MASVVVKTIPTLSTQSPNARFGIWLYSIVIHNSSSLIIDGIDVIRYISGDRTETVQGLGT